MRSLLSSTSSVTFLGGLRFGAIFVEERHGFVIIAIEVLIAKSDLNTFFT